MKPTAFGGNTYRCANEAFWPPAHSSIGSSEDIRPRFPEAVYERMKSWERACGLKEMSEDKCPKCRFLRDANGKEIGSSTSLPAPPIYRRGGR